MLFKYTGVHEATKPKDDPIPFRSVFIGAANPTRASNSSNSSGIASPPSLPPSLTATTPLCDA